MERRRLAWTALWFGLAGARLAVAGEKTEEAARLFEARRLADARPLLEAAVKEDPSDARAAFYLGRLLLGADDLKAVEWLEKATSLDAGRAEYHLWLGRAYGMKAIRASVLQQPSLARKVKRQFERASELDPENLEARFGLIEFYLRAPGVLGGSAAKARDQAAEINRRDSLQGHRAAARIAEHEKRFDAALQEYSAAAREFPEDPEPLDWIGRFHEHRKEYARAFDVYERLLEKWPEQLGACYQIGRIAVVSGERLDRGVECLKLYLTHSPKPEEPSLASAHYRLGLLYEKKGEKDLARREYTAALDLDPTLQEARQTLNELSVISHQSSVRDRN